MGETSFLDGVHTIPASVSATIDNYRSGRRDSGMLNIHDVLPVIDHGLEVLNGILKGIDLNHAVIVELA